MVRRVPGDPAVYRDSQYHENSGQHPPGWTALCGCHCEPCNLYFPPGHHHCSQPATRCYSPVAIEIICWCEVTHDCRKYRQAGDAVAD
jgi:hypothetical protein